VKADELRGRKEGSASIKDLRNVVDYVRHMEKELEKAPKPEKMLASGGWSTPADKTYDLTPAKKPTDYMSQGYTSSIRRVRYGSRYWMDWTVKWGGVQVAEGSDLTTEDAERHIVQAIEQEIKRRKELNRKETSYIAESGRKYMFSHEVKRFLYGGISWSVWNAEGKMIATGITRSLADGDKEVMRSMKEWVKDKEGSKPVHRNVETVRGDRTYKHSYVVINRGAGEFQWTAFVETAFRNGTTTLPLANGKASSLAQAEANAKSEINTDCNHREIKLSVQAVKDRYTVPLPPASLFSLR